MRIEAPLPVSFSAFTSVRREATRPLAQRDERFAGQFDDDTLFFDAFFSGKAGEIILIGPPLLNLEPLMVKMRLVAQPANVACTFRYKKRDRHMQVWVSAPEGTTGLRLECPAGQVDVPVSPNGTDEFAGRRVLFTLSKNNRIDWIQDWVRYHRDVHGADAVIIYDNSSTAYDAATLMQALQALKGLKHVRVVSWPFKYGPQGTMERGTWDSDFCQSGALEHVRWRYLQQAASVMNGDIDELVVGPDARGVFAATEASLFGIKRYYGRWVFGVQAEGIEVPAQERAVHRDFRITLRPQLKRGRFFRIVDGARCSSKWTVVPRRCPKASQWRIHGMSGWLVAQLTSVRISFRHFRSINNGWKYNRDEVQSFDANIHEMDAALQANYARVDWQN